MSQPDIQRAGIKLKSFSKRISRILGRKKLLLYLAFLGPGIIAGNAGNDAGGIATYASVGADYGYSLLWSYVVLVIGLCVVQEMCARMGLVTGQGLADLIREQFGVRPTFLVMLALLITNAGVTISEFIGIVLASELFGVPRYISVPLAAAAVWWLVIRGSYQRVERIFLVMSLVFFGYIISAFLARPNWHEVGQGLLSPQLRYEPGYLFTLMAVIGTTISPYMQIFVQSSVVEKNAKIDDLGLVRADSYAGSIFSIIIAFFITVATAATLNKQGIHIETAADAARALEPLAGRYASLLFAVGLLGASMLAAGVLPLATAYSMSEALGFEKGVSHNFREAPIFLGVFSGLILVGAGIAVLPGINPIQILLITQVINGLLLPVLLIAILLLVNQREVMGNYVNGALFNILAVITTVIVSGLSLLLLCSTLLDLIYK